MLVVAAFFHAEQRYRVPYDLTIAILALEGLRSLASSIHRRLGRLAPRS
jgi:hypothetical protein